MKRFFCLLSALLLVFSCAGAEMVDPAAESADTREADLLDIFQADGEGRTWITAAVQAADGMLLTSPALLPEGTDNLIVSDGKNEWKVKAVLTDSTGIMAMVFFDTAQILPQRRGWPLMPLGDSAKAVTCLVRSGSADGRRIDCGVRSADSLHWKGCRCLLLDLEAEASPGAAVLNAKGELAGLVFANYAEGQRRVLALPVEEIIRGITEAGEQLYGLYSWGDPPKAFM